LLDNIRFLSYPWTVSPESSVHYPIRAAAKLTGLSIDTLRAWERRYQAVTPLRAERGRAYDAGHIRRLVLLRDVVDRGHAIGQVASLENSELEELLAGPAEVPRTPKPAGAGQEVSDGLQPVVAAIESFDYATANAQLGRLAALLPVRELVGEVVLPLMRLVGDRWREGTLTVAQEHMTSAILRNLLGGLVRLRAPSGQPPRLLFATPSGELHEFGILAAALLALASGFDALYLGPNLPAREIVAAAERTSPQAVVLGIKTSEPDPVTIEELRLVASKLPKRTELWLGGSEVRKALPSVRGGRVFILEDFGELDVHLARLKTGSR
jgi:methanogenic corrinoid protein MtbC1